MGALTGSVTAMSYRVQGDVAPGYRDDLLEKLNRKGFREIEINSDQEEASGWVQMEDPFSTTFDLASVFWDRYALFAMRLDTLKIPPATLRLYLRRDMARFLEQVGKERASRDEEENVRDLLIKTLRRRLLPTTKVCEVIWNVDEGDLWFFSASKKLNELFQERFHQAFGLAPIPRNTYGRLEELGLDTRELELACELEPTSFAAPPDY